MRSILTSGTRFIMSKCLGATLSARNGTLLGSLCHGTAQSLASVTDASTLAWRSAGATPSEVANYGGSAHGGGLRSPGGLHPMPGHLPGKGHGCLGARASIVSSCCTFPVSGEQAANTSNSACAGIGSVFGAAMPWCRHYGSSTAARVHPKGWRQLPGRALPGRRGLVKHRGRGAGRRPLEHGSSQWVFAQEIAELRQQLQKQDEQHQRAAAELRQQLRKQDEQHQRAAAELRKQLQEQEEQHQRAAAELRKQEEQHQRAAAELRQQLRKQDEQHQRAAAELRQQPRKQDEQHQRAAAELRQQLRKQDEQNQRAAAELRQQLRKQDEQHQKLQAELAPLQSQFARNVVPQAAKFALTRSQPCARTTTSTYVDNASPEQLQALADVVGLSAGELKEGLTAMARLHNGGDHPGDLATLQQMVKDALQVCGERPTDPELAFAQRVLLRYAAIEDASLLPHPSAR